MKSFDDETREKQRLLAGKPAKVQDLITQISRRNISDLVEALRENHVHDNILLTVLLIVIFAMTNLQINSRAMKAGSSASFAHLT